MISFKKVVQIMAAFAFLALTPSSLFSQTELIKFATLAPEGSAWMNVMRDLNAELKKETRGRLGFKIYSGGVAGDEKDVLRKIRIGEIQAGGFTGVGLGEIAPEARILDAPWLFKNAAEVDFIRKRFHANFERAFENGGFILLGWTDLGFVRFFSQNPFSTPEALKKDKIWIWEGDPIAEAAFKVLGISPIPLSELDVMTSLQTGMINTVYGPPLAVTALQWFTKTRFIDPVPLAYASGAVLISKPSFDALNARQKKILKKISSQYLTRLNSLARKENEEALSALQKQGLTLGPRPPARALEFYAKMGDSAREISLESFTPKSFSSTWKNLSRISGKIPAMGAIKKIERGLDLIETALLVVVLSFMIFLAFLQVILRNIFHSGILWADPLLRHLVVWLGFLGAAFAAAQGKHFAWEMPKLKNKNITVALKATSNLLGALIAFLLALAARQYEIEERTFGRTLFRIGSLKVPSWVSAEIIVVGFALVGCHLILRMAASDADNNRELDPL